MNVEHSEKIARETGISHRQVVATLALLEEGATIPFISRYRKEVTGSLDELQIGTIRDRARQLTELDARREVILTSIREQGKLTPALEKQILSAATTSELEDLYLPYKPRRRTRATIAREKGLEPLADWIWLQKNGDPEQEAVKYISSEKGVASHEDALAGARDIIAERVSEDTRARTLVRGLMQRKGMVRTKAVKSKIQDGAKYRDYFDWREAARSAPSHRLLAMLRAAEEGFVAFSIEAPDDEALDGLNRQYVRGRNAAAAHVEEAIADGYKRLLFPSMENEMRNTLKEKADAEAIRVFAENLRQLLLAAPLGRKVILALDPGFRTGCKAVVIDAQGNLLHYEAIFPNPPHNKVAQSEIILRSLAEKYRVEAIAIGNGTAGRETEEFVKDMGLKLPVIMVNESGASIYSASEVAREEFPDEDVTVRGAVSIGRRLMDPLAELVKIDPKSIGVGQYQHDVDQAALRGSLDEVVMSCVNKVGVEVNTASKQLLTYVSGLGPQLAKNIVEYRHANGPFKSRKEIIKVPRLGAKAFEQAAGFLRIHGAKNPLDTSAVHPERYDIVEKMAKDLNCSISDLIHQPELRKKIKLENYVDESAGMETLRDILSELDKPGRDPREKFEMFDFAEGVNSLEDLAPGMVLPGIVTNITRFGAFVDVGVHQDGMVHISEMADKFIRDASEVVKLQQKVKVKVLEVDMERKRISLSMKTK